MDGMGWGDIIFFGAIAAFIILRYRAMLGEQHGRDSDQVKRDQAERESEYERIIQLPQQDAQTKPQPTSIIKREPSQDYGTALEANFDAMAAIDRSFDIEEFKEGAKAAFEMVVQAFNDADRPTLRELLARDIYKNFDAVLNQRDDENAYPHTTLVAVSEATITHAALSGKTASIHVKFVSEQVQLVKDRDGNVTDGNAGDIETVEDVWVFERNLSASNPAWVITQT